MEKLVLAALVSGAFAVPTFNFAPRPVFNPPAPFHKSFVQDCVYGEFTPWSDCQAACDSTAFQSRTRVVLKEASGYGQKCTTEALEEWRECRGEPCARDCQMDSWTAWSDCSTQCDGGQRQRWRRVISNAVAGGAPCGPQEEAEPCNTHSCAVDCVQTPWSLWSDCSAQCEEGRRQRIRNTIVQSKFGGIACGPAEEWEACNNGPCPQDCAYDAWAPWTNCPACGEASRTRSRNINQQGLFGGAVCDFGSLSESESCNNRPCAVDCVMESWAAWSRCSADCGPGRRARTRSVISPAKYGGLACGPQEEWEACLDQPCAVDCAQTQWASWSQCSKDCDGGRRARLRSTITPAKNGGLACGPQEEWEGCNQQECARDCAYGDWAEWSQCPSCGQASRSRRRPIASPANSAGRQCDFGSLAETESCNNRPCPVDCVMSQWTAYSRCSADCDEGRRSRTRTIFTPARFGGLACGPQEEWEACNNGPCASDCVQSSWSAWSDCSAQCEEGRRQRLRNTIAEAKFGGLSCGPAEEWEACNAGPCARDCAYGSWAPWSQCPSCGQASRSRSRDVLVQGAFGGAVCDFGNLAETENCPFIACPVDCEVTRFSAWSACSAECGSGRQSRTRSIATRPANGGAQCPGLEEWRACESKPCREPSPCDGTTGTVFLAEGCSADFTLCSRGVAHPKICPGASRFDVATSSCRLPQDVPACAAPANPPAPKGYFSSFFN